MNTRPGLRIARFRDPPEAELRQVVDMIDEYGRVDPVGVHGVSKVAAPAIGSRAMYHVSCAVQVPESVTHQPNAIKSSPLYIIQSCRYSY